MRESEYPQLANLASQPHPKQLAVSHPYLSLYKLEQVLLLLCPTKIEQDHS